MSNDSVKLNSFPGSDIEALAMLYTENQNLKGKSVIEIADIYYNAYYELLNSNRELRFNARDKYRKQLN